MNQKKFNDTVCNVAEEIGFLSYDARSAASVLRLIVEEIDDSELQEQPYAALPGALALVEAVAEKMEKVNALSTEMLRVRVLVENDTKALITESVRAGVAALGYDLSEHDITIGDIADLRCVVNIDGKRFGIWDAVKKTFVD